LESIRKTAPGNPILKAPEDQQRLIHSRLPSPRDALESFLVDKNETQHREISHDFEMNALKTYMGLCAITGYSGLGPVYRQTVDEPTAFFFQDTPGTLHVVYAGRVVFEGNPDDGMHSVWDLGSFLIKMKQCGNWEQRNYQLFWHNCNDFTDAVMKALHFPSLTEIMVTLGHSSKGLPERYLGVFGKHRWIPEPGVWDVMTSTCVGVKCVGPQMQFDPVKWGKPEPDECARGICHGGGMFNPNDATCA